MDQPALTITLIVLTLLSLTAWMLALRHQRLAVRGDAEGPPPVWLTWMIVAVGAAVFFYRALLVHEEWFPLEAHVDGLLLIGVLIAGVVLFLQLRAGVRGLSIFALPLVALIFAWGICASLWTFRPFGHLDSIWQAIHLASVYGGMLFFAIAAIAGGMYLYVQRRLRQTHDPTSTRPFASLEALENQIIRTSAFGFAMLTLGLVTGLIVVMTNQQTRLGAGWWYSPKVVLAAGVWVIYAVVMNVRHTSNFRGARAAWLSIAGMVLLVATFGVATALPPLEKQPAPQVPMGETLDTPGVARSALRVQEAPRCAS